jgi:hypothetical protein
MLGYPKYSQAAIPLQQDKGEQPLMPRGPMSGHLLAYAVAMEQLRKGRAFLEGGLWVPLEVAGPLGQSLQVLHAWLTTERPRNPTMALLVHRRVTELEHLLDAGIRHHRLVPVDRWKHAVSEIQLLTNWLAAPR